MRALSFVLVGLALATASACGDDAQSTTAPTTTTAAVGTELFVGTLSPGGSRFYSFRVTNAGGVTLLLASLTAGSTQPALATTVQFGFGVPQGTGCGLTTSVDTPPGLIAQITNTSNPGIYCVHVADTGRLTAPADFAIRITHP